MGFSGFSLFLKYKSAPFPYCRKSSFNNLQLEERTSVCYFFTVYKFRNLAQFAGGGHFVWDIMIIFLQSLV